MVRNDWCALCLESFQGDRRIADDFGLVAESGMDEPEPVPECLVNLGVDRTKTRHSAVERATGAGF